jgi:hypothetical protein
MQLPPDMMKNTAAFLAFIAGALAGVGLALTLLSYVAFYFLVQGVDGVITAQFDPLLASVTDAQQTVSSAADAASFASGGLSNLSISFSTYADASDSIGTALSAFTQNPLLATLAPQITASVTKLNDASSSMRGAAAEFNSTAGSTGSASASLRQASIDISSAKTAMAQAKEGVKSALGMLSIMGFLAMLCALCLFSSVGLVSISMLLSHYPDLFAKKDGAQQPAQEQPQQ